jgi:hypothetical protein
MSVLALHMGDKSHDIKHSRYTPSPAVRYSGHKLHRNAAVCVVHPYFAQLRACHTEQQQQQQQVRAGTRLHDVQLFQRQRVFGVTDIPDQIKHFN